MNSRNTTPRGRTRWWGNRIVLAMGMGLLSASSMAQVSSYVFSVGSDPYTALSGATTFTINGGGGTLDDGYSALQPIGFNFNFGGTAATQFSVNSNGYLRLGATASISDYSVMDQGTMNNSIAFNNRDLNNTGAVYSYKLDGTPGSYICKIEANNFFRYGTSTHTGNAQIWLYEGTNVIEIRYGTYNTSWSTGTCQVGIRTTSSDVRNVISSTWAGITPASISGTNTGGITQATTNQVASGTKFTFTPPVPCTGTPTAGTATPVPASVCSGGTSVISLTGYTSGVSGITFAWEESDDDGGGDPWAAAVGGSGANTATYTTAALSGTRYYRCVVTCTNSSLSATSPSVAVTFNAASYAVFDGVSYSEGFESWSSACGNTDVPNNSWRNSPTTGNNSWRRFDQGVSTGGWGSSSGAYSPTFSQGAYSARFHTWGASSGLKGVLDLYIDMSAGSGANGLTFDYINPTGGDSLTIHQSIDGGATFVRLGAIVTTAASWTAVSRTITSTSATTVIRLRATSDFGNDDIGVDNLVITSPCTGTPTAGTATPVPASMCSGGTSVISLTGYTNAVGITFAWEESDDNGGGDPWAAAVGGSGANTATYTTAALSSTRYYRCVVTCTNSGLSANSPSVAVNVNAVSYAVFDGVSYSEGFESWSSACGNTDVPTNSWRNSPVTGNNSWRRFDQGVSTGGWGGNFGAYSPTFSQGAYSARFHSYNASSGLKGVLDLYIDMSAGSGANGLTFDYINPTGGDSLTIHQSTDGGATFVRLGAIVTTAASWTAVSRTITSTSATTVIRLRATSDYGNDDIGVDNLVINSPCTGTPTAGTATPVPASVCSGGTSVISLTGYSNLVGITFAWEESDDNGGGDPWAAAVGGSGANTATYTTAGLTGTRYYRCVVTCTNSGLSANSPSVPVTVTAGSLTEDFSSGNTTSNCWSHSGTGSAGNLAYNGVSGFGIGTGSIKWNYYNESSGNTLIYTSPVISPIGSGMQLEFDVAGATYTGGEVDQVNLEASSDGGTTWTLVQAMDNDDSPAGLLNTGGVVSGNFTPTSAQWASRAFPLPAGTNRVRFLGTSDFGNGVYIDNIDLTAVPGCPTPSGVTASGTTHNSTNVNFTCSGCSGTIIVEYGLSGFTPGTDNNPGIGGTLITGAVSPQAITGLSPTTAYQVYVRQDCTGGGNGYSTNSSVASFTTLATPPANDLCANAIAVSCNTVTNATTVASTTTGAPTGCSDDLTTAGGIWYTLQGWDGPMTVDLSGSGYDTKLGVFTGTCGSLVCVDSDDDSGVGTTSLVTFAGSSSETYYVYVTGYSTNTGSVVMTVTCGSTNPVCSENGLNLEFQTDGFASEVTWEVLNAGNLVVLSGANPVPNNQIGTQALCLPDGCYRLRVLDSGGDGMTTGGYELRTTGNERIIDNTNNFSNGSVSAISSNQTFCLPIGTDKPIYSSCDKLDWVNNKFIVCHANAAVTAEYGVTNATSGYEFWFYDPNGSYSFRRFRSHSTSDGYGSGATRACHFKVNGWINSPATPHLPANILLNVRVRGRVAGNNLEFGPACQFKIDAALAACPRVNLQDDPANVSDYSCGVSREFGGASRPANRIYAKPPQPVPVVPSANVRYQFRFRIDGEGICIVRPPQTSARMVLNWTTGTPLQCTKVYEVDVRVSLDGGATWCFGPGASDEASACADTNDWGKVCLVTINCPPMDGGGNSMALQGDGGFTMYPNPNRGDQLFVNMSSVQEGVQTVSVDIFDLTGKRVSARTIAVQDGSVRTNMDLNGDLAGGMYMVHVTAGDKTYTERLVIQP